MEGKKTTNLYNVTMTARHQRRMGDWVLSLFEMSVCTPIQMKRSTKKNTWMIMPSENPDGSG